MHDTAMMLGKMFFDQYVQKSGLHIVDIGAQDVNGSLRSVSSAQNKYTGVDFVKGKGVDIVITDPYTLPFEDNSIDVIVCSSCFEHAEFFWLMFTEILRALKPSGILYLNVPANGVFHRFPVDCWRFYPDSGKALENWGKRNQYPCVLLESFTGTPITDIWNDFVAVFLKDQAFIPNYPNRIQAIYQDYIYGITYENPSFTNYKEAQYETADLESKLRNVSRELEQKRTAIEEIYNSSSWRMTAPIRKIRNLLKINRVGEAI